jgi:hypothetical protein
VLLVMLMPKIETEFSTYFSLEDFDVMTINHGIGVWEDLSLICRAPFVGCGG